MDPVACNYSEEATLADDNCDYVTCAGCLEVDGCNYDATATLSDSNLCEYPAMHYDCLGNCLNDMDGDGVCDELEVLGCTDAEAANFYALATDEDGGCLYPGCTLIQALNFDPGANEDDGSCLVEGCTYSTATNYDPLATNDDGSCTFDGVNCPEDADDDGICDVVDPCVGTYPTVAASATALAPSRMRVQRHSFRSLRADGNALDASGCVEEIARPTWTRMASVTTWMTASARWMNVGCATGQVPPINAAATTFLKANAIVTATHLTPLGYVVETAVRMRMTLSFAIPPSWGSAVKTPIGIR